MKVENANVETGFKPVVLTVTLESVTEVKTLFQLFGYDVTLPREFARLANQQKDAEQIATAFFRGMRAALHKELCV